MRRHESRAGTASVLLAVSGGWELVISGTDKSKQLKHSYGTKKPEGDNDMNANASTIP